MEVFGLHGGVSSIAVESFGDISNVIVTFKHHKTQLSEDLPGCLEEAMIPEDLVPQQEASGKEIFNPLIAEERIPEGSIRTNDILILMRNTKRCGRNCFQRQGWGKGTYSHRS